MIIYVLRAANMHILLLHSASGTLQIRNFLLPFEPESPFAA